jgi:uncharacterized protein (TIGR00369 family)
MSEVLARLQASIRRSPFQEWLGVTLQAGDAAAGTASVRLPFRPEFARTPGADQIHGGVIAALADIAGDYALAMSLGGGVPTIDLRVDYLRPAAGDLVATAMVVKRGRTIGVVDVQIRDTGERLVAIGRGAYSTTVG